MSLQNWHMQINGKNEFVRGLNWVPADIFPGGVTSSDYAGLLRQAQKAGANLLRVWGGGLREKRAFYQQCDELGLLVWQEFPFACMFLGTFPKDDAFLKLVEQEVAEIGLQLNNHPSLVLWCGGNEFSPRRNKTLVRTVEQTLNRVCHTRRPFLPASPGPDDAHNWLVWHGLAPLAAYRQEEARFLSEFGLQALPNKNTLEAMLTNPGSKWETHHGDVKKLYRYLKLFTDNGPQTLQKLIKASQQAQAAGLQIAIEHMRRRKAKTGGVIIWQLNEPWPAISWAIIDYFRHPKLAYKQLPQWYHPVLASLEFEPGRNWQAGQRFAAKVWGVNDSLDVIRGAWCVKLDGQTVFEQERILLPDSAMQIGEFSHPLRQKPATISVELHAGERLITRNSYDLSWHDSASTRWWHRFRRWAADQALK